MLFKRIFSSKVSATAGASAVVGNILQQESSNDRFIQPESTSTILRNTLNIKDSADDDYIVVDDRKYQVPNYPPIVLQDVEIEACIDTLRSSPHMLEQFLPPESMPSDMVGFRRDISNIMTIPDVIDQVRKIVTQHNRSVMNLKVNELSATDQWELLSKKYPCALCQDVLAAPVIFNCSHNFCGSCAESLFESCVACDEYFTVGHPCPHCREELENPSYERLLDENILIEVENIPSCEMKTSYQERRQEYFEKKKEREESAKHKKINPLEFLRMYTGRDNQSNENEAMNTEEHRDASYWESLKEWSIPRIAFLVIAITLIVRYSSKK